MDVAPSPGAFYGGDMDVKADLVAIGPHLENDRAGAVEITWSRDLGRSRQRGQEAPTAPFHLRRRRRPTRQR